VAIRAKTGEIIDIDVAMMSPAGTTVRLARDRYPHWRESRQGARESVFRSIGKCAKPGAVIRTDQCDHYPPIARRLAPCAKMVQHMSPGNPENPATRGFNPMFKLDHLFATLRQDLVRLGRSTWATTKTLNGLLNHLTLYVACRNGYEVA